MSNFDLIGLARSGRSYGWSLADAMMAFGVASEDAESFAKTWRALSNQGVESSLHAQLLIAEDDLTLWREGGRALTDEATYQLVLARREARFASLLAEV